MIDRLPGWSWELTAGSIVLASDAGRIHYVERVQPMRRLGDILRDLPAPTGWTPGGAPRVERLLTNEEELAAIAVVSGTMKDRAAVRATGVVWLDDWYAVIDGLGGDTIEATVSRLTISDVHMRGDRRRRFVYARPPGWQALFVPPYHAYWLAPDFPRGGVYAIAFPALPRAQFRGDAQGLIQSLGALPTGPGEPLRKMPLVTSARGLSGHRLDAPVPLAVPTTRVFIVLEDHLYLYPLMLETPDARLDAELPVLLKMVDSVEPLRRHGPTASPSWVD